MSDQPGARFDTSPPAADSGGIGCLAGIGTAIAIPAFVFCGILIVNALNPRCGTPGDSGGCEMGLASGTISAILPSSPRLPGAHYARGRDPRAMSTPGELGLAARLVAPTMSGDDTLKYIANRAVCRAHIASRAGSMLDYAGARSPEARKIDASQ
jgi:hypothetical protein